MAQWYFKKNNQKVGPLNDAQMRQVARDGMLLPSDAVWREGLKEWVPASRIKGLFPAVEGFSAMATMQDPMSHGAAIRQQQAASSKSTGKGLPSVEVFEPTQIEASRLPTVMAKPIGEHHHVKISQQPGAPVSGEKPYEPPPLPPMEEKSAAPVKPMAPAGPVAAAKPAVPPPAKPRNEKPAESPVSHEEEEPVKVQQAEDDEFLSGIEKEMGEHEATQAADESVEVQEDANVEQAAEEEMRHAQQPEETEQTESVITEDDLFKGEPEESFPQEAGKPAFTKPEKKSKPVSELPDEESAAPKPGVGLALAACAIGLLSAAPAGVVVYLAMQGGAAETDGNSILESYKAAVSQKLSGGLNAALADWQVLIGLSGVLTVLVGLLALIIKTMRKTAAAIFILLALAGLAGHVVVFQVPLWTADIAMPPKLTSPSKYVPKAQPAQDVSPKPAPQPAAKPATEPAPAATPASLSTATGGRR